MSFNVFDVVGSSFFLPLACSNRRFYSDCIIDLYDYISNSGEDSISKDVAFHIIDCCLKEKYGGNICCEEDDYDTEPYSKPSGRTLDRPLTKEIVYSKLLRCGWLVKEVADDGRSFLISFTNYAEAQVDALKKISFPKKIYLGGYAKTVKDALVRIKDTKYPYKDALYVAWENTKALAQEIRHIRNSLKEDINKILDPNNSYEVALVQYNEYLDRALEGDLRKLQVDEGITPQLQADVRIMLESIDFDDDLYECLIEDVLDYHVDLSSREEAVSRLQSCLNFIKNTLCDGINERLQNIVDAQSKYTTNAMTKIALMCTDNKTLDSDFNLLVQNISEMSDEEFSDWEHHMRSGSRLRHMFQPSGASYVSLESLYKPKIKSNGSSADEAEVEEEASLLFGVSDIKACHNKFNIRAVNRWVQKALSGEKSVSSRSLSVASKNDFEAIVAMIINSDDPSADYVVDFAEENSHVTIGDYTFPEFVLKPKEVVE